MFVPPPPGTDCSRKYQLIDSWSRVSISQVNQAMPPPPAAASPASRQRRPALDSFGENCGSSASPISSSTVETTSTDSCVIARSGADSATKASEATRPTPPVSTTATKRCRCCTSSRPPVTSSSPHTPTATGGAGSNVRACAPRPSSGPVQKGRAANTTASATIHAA